MREDAMEEQNRKNQEETSVETSTDTAVETPTDTNADPGRKIPWKKVGIGAGCAAAVLLVVFFGFAVFFRTHFCFRSTINGVSVAGLTVRAAQTRLQNQAEGYELTIIDEEQKEETLSAEDMGMHIDIDEEEIQSLLHGQKPFLWVYESICGMDYVSEELISCDEDVLAKSVAKLSCVKKKNVTKTKDAGVEYKDGSFEITEEVYGNEIERKEFQARVEEAALTLQEKLDLVEDKCYVQPKYTKDSKKVKKLVKTLNAYVKTDITYQVGSATEQIPKDVIGSWLYAGEKMEPGFREDAMREFISSLAKKYDTFGQAKQLQTQYGVSVTVPGGNYGWKIDKDGEIAKLKEDLASGKKVKRDFVYQYTAASHDGNDYGNSYVEINRTAQHLYLVINGAVVMDTNVVTGNPNNGHTTPVGAYRITYCQRNATLRGPDYVTPVAYWMPFNGDIGLHDATWQSAFGGTRYKDGYGSHGCVNLPLSAAGTIFSYVSTGFPVLMYDLAGTETLDNVTQQAVTNCKNAINAIGWVDASKGAAIAAARGMYDALPESAKGYVDNLQVLLDAEGAFFMVQVDAADQAAANRVIDLINRIGTVDASAECRGRIEAAESAYNKLSANARSKVGNYQTLVDARQKFNQLPQS